MSSPRIVVAALGDSITAGTPLWDPDPGVRREIGDRLDEQSQWPYWAARADPRLEFRNHGINLQETAEIAARLDAAVDGADVLVVQGGVNDLVHGKPLEGAASNLREMVRRGKELGLGVAIVELVPNNNFPELEEPIRRLNGHIHSLAGEESVPVLPFYAALEDPDRPGRMRPEYTDDGNHPSVEGHRRLGEHAFEVPGSPA
jgi:lysophospholipase L1-like esterase